jgi:hypothetical protein
MTEMRMITTSAVTMSSGATIVYLLIGPLSGRPLRGNRRENPLEFVAVNCFLFD